MSNPKRQHFNPEMLSGRFTDDGGYLHAFDRREPSKIISAKPRDLFVQGHLYTQYRANNERDFSIEKAFSEIERLTSIIFDNILSAVREGRIPALSPRDRAILNRFYYLQWKRTPDSMELTNPIEEVESGFQELIADLEMLRGPLPTEERSRLDDPVVRKHVLQNARAQAAGTPSDRVERELARHGLSIAHVQMPKKAFVIGSFPIVRIEPSASPDALHAEARIWLPIASDVAISPLIGAQTGQIEVLALRDPAYIRMVNESILRQSTTIAGRSQALVRSLAKTASFELS